MLQRAIFSTALCCLLTISHTRSQPPPANLVCETADIYDALDFTLGRWEIVVNEKSVAWIELEKDGADCLIRERYGVYSSDHSGAGIDYWDAGNNVWRRILVTSVGTIETFEGFFADGKFVWNGREKRVSGEIVLERVEMWLEGETLRNDIYQSKNGGVTWQLKGSETRIRRED